MRVKLSEEGELGLKDMYKFYKEKTTNPVTYKEYREINTKYLKGIMDLIIHKAYNFRLPARLGFFRIRKTRIDYESGKFSIDWKQSKELGITVYHLNEHSDGFRAKFLWEKKRAILKEGTKRPYSFTLARDVRRNELGGRMKQPNGHAIYHEEIINKK